MTGDAIVGRKLPSRPGLEEHVRVILGNIRGRTIAMPLAAGAGMMTSLVGQTESCAFLPKLPAFRGEKKYKWNSRPAETMDNRILAVGSHDLTIDLLASLVKEKSAGKITIASSNVGSIGGLVAIQKGIAHFAGAHLLDPQTGDYNHSCLRQYVPDVPVTLITLVYRWQGFMVRRAIQRDRGMRTWRARI